MEFRFEIFIVILIAGVLATDFWRIGGGIFGARLNEDSKIFRWVRMVATALVAALVTKLTLYTQGALGDVSALIRASGIFISVATFIIILKYYSYNLALAFGVFSGVLWLLVNT